ncbi:hypothetical protein DWW10_00575 [Bacteroides intestinalis]|uniref:NVEALA protein n=2 Tax=Bacteroides intestinalis TaxID=329854 RepID=A0A412YL94_9BACE|nr:hypothetical protein DWW10_00575 [Bacteroides intestinalis]RHA63248.1 hypothetical protein DW932_00565 [Bacteroides intestinalis]
MKNSMKKILVFIVVIAIAMGGYVYKKQSTARMSSLLLENIEALADPETGHRFCFGTGSVDCPFNHVKVYTYASPYSLHY